MALVVTACGPTAAPDTARTHVCIASNSEGPAPHTFNQLAADGARGAGAGVQGVASRAPSDYLGSLQRCVASKPDLVIAISPDMATAVWRAAQLHGDQRFALADAAPIFFFQAEDGIRDLTVTGVQTCALPI